MAPSDPIEAHPRTSPVRLFMALEVPAPVRQLVSALQETLAAEGVKARWVPVANVHITLRFLGSVSERRLAAVGLALETAAAAMSPFELETGGFGQFPVKGPPRVLWLGIRGQTDRLVRLKALLDTALDEVAGIPLESQSFHAHLTLARFKGRTGRGGLCWAMERCGPLMPAIRFSLKAAALFESRLDPKGARYSRLRSVPFAIGGETVHGAE